MKFIFIVLISFYFLHAGTLSVKEDFVKVCINGDLYTINKNEEKNFIDGSTICYEDGQGRLIINNSIQLIKNEVNCIQTEIKDENLFKDLVVNLKDNLLVSFSNTKEKVLDGVSSKDINFNNNVENIKINKKQKYIIVRSESSGPLPIKLIIKNKEDKIIKSFINKKGLNTNFILNVNELEKGNSIYIYNGFNMIIKNIIID